MIYIETQNLIKSPLNYTGGKYKLLPQILPLFPKKINIFVDLFCGGCNVGINVQANKVICNDIQKPLIDFFNACKKYDAEYMIAQIKELINTYQLSKINKEGYLELRNFYNKGNKNWATFYTLVCYSFNNQIRFNSKNEFNMPFGKGRSSFNSSLQLKFKKFVNHIKHININFTNNDFRKFDINMLSQDDFVYADPPYLISTATYNEQDGWNEKNEIELLKLLDYLDEKKVKFALSNVLEHKGKYNHILMEWSKKYKIHYLNYNYNNCNYHKKNKGKSVEVLIVNY